MPSPLIVIEGPDGMGKSTLSNTLRSRYPQLQFHHTGGPKTNSELEEICLGIEALEGPVLLDRSPMISEIVYRPLKGVRPFTKEEEGVWLRRHAKIATLTVVCRVADSVEAFLKLSLSPRPHKSAAWWDNVVRNYEHIVAGYDRLLLELPDWGAPVYVYDWNLDPQAIDLDYTLTALLKGV